MEQAVGQWPDSAVVVKGIAKVLYAGEADAVRDNFHRQIRPAQETLGLFDLHAEQFCFRRAMEIAMKASLQLAQGHMGHRREIAHPNAFAGMFANETQYASYRRIVTGKGIRRATDHQVACG